MEIQYILLAVAILAGLWYYFTVYRKSSVAGAPAEGAPAAAVEEEYAEEQYAEEEYVEEEYEDEDPKEKSM